MHILSSLALLKTALPSTADDILRDIWGHMRACASISLYSDQCGICVECKVPVCGVGNLGGDSRVGFDQISFPDYAPRRWQQLLLGLCRVAEPFAERIQYDALAMLLRFCMSLMRADAGSCKCCIQYCVLTNSALTLLSFVSRPDNSRITSI